MKKLGTALMLLAFVAVHTMPHRSFAADLPLKPPPAKTAPAKPKAGNDFGKLGADCIEATDGCRNYARAADGKFDATNNIGIACQPKPLTCSKRR